MLSFLTGGKKDKSEKMKEKTGDNTTAESLFAQADKLIKQNNQTKQTNDQTIMKNEEKKPLNLNLNFKDPPNRISNPITRNPFANTPTPQNTTNVSKNQVINAPGGSTGSKIPRMISTLQPQALKSTTNIRNPPGNESTSRSNTSINKLINETNNTRNSIYQRPNVSGQNQNTTRSNSMKYSTPKIGTVTLHVSGFQFQNKNSIRTKGATAIKSLIRFAVGKHKPKFNRAFAPRGHPRMSAEQIAFILLSLLRAFNPSGFKGLVEMLSGDGMRKPTSISFKESPVRVNIDVKSRHNSTRNSDHNSTHKRKQDISNYKDKISNKDHISNKDNISIYKDNISKYKDNRKNNRKNNNSRNNHKINKITHENYRNDSMYTFPGSPRGFVNSQSASTLY